MGEVLWAPTPERAAQTLLADFMERHDHADYESLWSWSIGDRAGFWSAVWEDGSVIASEAPAAAIGVEAMPGTEWFPGARLNLAENLLRRADDGIAIVAASESGDRRQIRWSELRTSVARMQASLVDLGVRPGDRVAGLVPNGPEAIVAMLATTATGAIWSSCSPDFGPLGVIDRFGQIEPKVLVATDGYRYNGREHGTDATVAAVADAIEGLKAIVAVDTIGTGLSTPKAPIIPWEEALAGTVETPVFAQLPFDHPAYIMYSSGTTGPPKSIVHGAGGTLLKHLSEHRLHGDVRRDDRVFWFTTCGWMMWNWLVGALAAEATIVLYDGSPSHPDLGALWRLAAETEITHLGVSPKFLAANAHAGVVPRDHGDLGAMRWLGSTGAPLNPDQFDWVYEQLGPDLQLASISGGTDIIGCFALGVPTLPVRRGELQARALGMAVEAWDPDNRPQIGTKGELVCTAPFPSMPVAFWGDTDGSRYRAAYFDEHPGVWTHGDYIEIRPEGGVIVYGRSDTTLNPGGVRIGTAEIYRAVESLAEVEDSIVVGRDVDGDIEVVLFVVMRSSQALDAEAINRIKATIRSETSPRHVPGTVAEVSAVPYTLSGKKVEKAVRDIISGHPVENRDALANPDVLDEYPAAAGQ